MKKGEVRKIVWVGIFAIAMAFVETMIVYYLRKLYYPNNILFPLNTSMPMEILILEWIREAATIVMLLGIAAIAGKKFKEKFAYFIYAFAVWDIFYYVWLKVTLNWPASLLDWDVLFLIPITWVSPVICPIIVSLTMIFYAFVILKRPNNRFRKREITILSVGALLMYVSFVWNYSTLLLKKGFVLKFSESMIGQEIITLASTYVPDSFNWPLFIVGEALALLSLYLYCRNR